MSNLKWAPYIKITRLNRWPLNLLLIPGYLISVIYSHQFPHFHWQVIPALIALCLAAFSNYTINDYLDGQFDALHPEKKHRPGARGLLKIQYVLCEYFLLALAALSLAYWIDHKFLLLIFIFLVMGVLYNVSPIRTKDKPYLDILSESINNPLRFICGWFVVPHAAMPPFTILLSCWMAGAFFMTMKRFAEFRHINNPKLVALYRRSFQYYNAKKLLSLAIVFILLTCLFLSTFFFEFKTITLLALPLIMGLFVWYTRIGFLPNSPVQHPELIYRYQPAFFFYAMFVAVATLTLFL